jgi:acetoacetyl-CoA reductase
MRDCASDVACNDNREDEYGACSSRDRRQPRHRCRDLQVAEGAGYKVAANYAGNDEAANKFKARPASRSINGASPTTTPASPASSRSRPTSGPIDVLVNNAGITRDAMFHRMTPSSGTRSSRPTSPALQHDPSALARDARAQVRADHHDQLDQRPEGPGRAEQLLGRQGRRHRHRQGAGARRCPGPTSPSTPSARAISAPRWSSAIDEKVLNERIIPHIPVGRLGEPEEIARCVVFLASDEAGFFTGSTLSPNGGQYMV